MTTLPLRTRSLLGNDNVCDLYSRNEFGWQSWAFHVLSCLRDYLRKRNEHILCLREWHNRPLTPWRINEIYCSFPHHMPPSKNDTVWFRALQRRVVNNLAWRLGTWGGSVDERKITFTTGQISQGVVKVERKKLPQKKLGYSTVIIQAA